MQGMSSHGATNGSPGSYAPTSTSSLEDAPVPGLAKDRIQQFIAEAFKTDKPESYSDFQYDASEQKATLTMLGRVFTFKHEYEWPAEEGTYRAALCRDIFSDILRKARSGMTWQGFESMIRVATVWQTIATLGPFPKGPRFEEIEKMDFQSPAPAIQPPPPTITPTASISQTTTPKPSRTSSKIDESVPLGPRSTSALPKSAEARTQSHASKYFTNDRGAATWKEIEMSNSEPKKRTPLPVAPAPASPLTTQATRAVTPSLPYDRIFGTGLTSESEQVNLFRKLAEEPPPPTAFLRIEQFFTLHFGQTAKSHVYQPYVAFEFNSGSQRAVLTLIRNISFSLPCTEADFALKQKEYKEELAVTAIRAKCMRDSLKAKIPKAGVRPHIDKIIELYSNLKTLGHTSAASFGSGRDRHISISGRSKTEVEAVPPKPSVLSTNANTTALPKFMKHAKNTAQNTAQSVEAPSDSAASAWKAAPPTSFPHPIAAKQRFASPVAISPPESMADIYIQDLGSSHLDMSVFPLSDRSIADATPHKLPVRPPAPTPAEAMSIDSASQAAMNGSSSQPVARTSETSSAMSISPPPNAGLPRRPSTDTPHTPSALPTAPAAMSVPPTNGTTSSIVLPEKVAAAISEIKEKQATAMKILEEQQKQRELALREQARQKLNGTTPLPETLAPVLPDAPRAHKAAEPSAPLPARSNSLQGTKLPDRPRSERQSVPPESTKKAEEPRREEGEVDGDSSNESRRSSRAASRAPNSRIETDKDSNDTRQKGNYTSRRERDNDRYDERNRDRDRDRERDKDREASRRSSVYDEPRHRKRSRSRTRSPVRERDRDHDDRRGDSRAYEDDEYRNKRRRASRDDTREDRDDRWSKQRGTPEPASVRSTDRDSRSKGNYRRPDDDDDDMGDERADRRRRQREVSEPVSARSVANDYNPKASYKRPDSNSYASVQNNSRLPTPPASASRPARTEDYNGGRSDTAQAALIQVDRLEKAIAQAKKTEEAFAQALGLISKHAKGGISLASAADAMKTLELSPTLQGTAQQALNDVFDALPQGLLKKANIQEDVSDVILLPRSWVQGTLALLSDVVEKK